MTRLLAPIALAAAGLTLACSGAAPAADCPATGPIAEAKGPFPLTGERTIRLQAACDRRAMTERLKSQGKDHRYLLVADDLRASVQPGTLFHLRLGRTRSAEAFDGETAEVGSINFFSARRPGASGPPHSVSFDVTAEARTLLASGWPAQGLGVAIAPSGAVAPGADASVGDIRLVTQ